MKFTFGIITTCNYGFYPKSLDKVFDSIALDMSYDDIEIIIVGGTDDRTWEHYKFIPFDESIKQSWITRKKNIITENAKYDNIVYMHDYVTLEYGWYKGFETFGDKFDICMTPIKNLDGSRYRDWTLWPHDITPDGSANLNSLLPYDVTNLSKYMYISGTYWIAKKEVMQRFPLDETLSWGESEDVKWSKQVREHYNFSINTNSSVKLLKLKDRVFNNAAPETITKLQNEIIQPK
jgi:hypothetical protein